MRKIVSLFTLLALAIGLMGAPVFAQVSQLHPDPCAAAISGVSGAAAMQSAPVAIASATTTSIVAPVTGAQITICGIWLNSVGGTSTIEYGTGATCGTGTTTMSGALAAATTLSIFPTRQMVFGSTPASQRLCILSGTSTSATEGWIRYMQQ